MLHTEFFLLVSLTAAFAVAAVDFPSKHPTTQFILSLVCMCKRVSVNLRVSKYCFKAYRKTVAQHCCAARFNGSFQSSTYLTHLRFLRGALQTQLA